MKVGTVPLTTNFSLQDVANVVGYNNLSDCENYASGTFPGGNTDNHSLLHFRGYYEFFLKWASKTNISETVTICNYSGNRILILMLGVAEETVREVNTPTLNGTPFTQAGNNNGSKWVEIWYLINPPIGNYTLSVTNSKTTYATLVSVPFVSSVSLHNTFFNSGNSNSPYISFTTPGTGLKSIVIMNIVCNPDTNIYNSVTSWFHLGTWVYSGKSSGQQEIIVDNISSPQTINYTLDGIRSWQIALCVLYY